MRGLLPKFKSSNIKICVEILSLLVGNKTVLYKNYLFNQETPNSETRKESFKKLHIPVILDQLYSIVESAGLSTKKVLKLFKSQVRAKPSTLVLIRYLPEHVVESILSLLWGEVTNINQRRGGHILLLKVLKYANSSEILDWLDSNQVFDGMLELVKARRMTQDQAIAITNRLFVKHRVFQGFQPILVDRISIFLQDIAEINRRNRKLLRLIGAVERLRSQLRLG